MNAFKSTNEEDESEEEMAILSDHVALALEEEFTEEELVHAYTTAIYPSFYVQKCNLDDKSLFLAIVTQYSERVGNSSYEHLIGGSFPEAMMVQGSRPNNTRIQILSRYQRVAFGQKSLTSYEQNCLDVVAKALQKRCNFPEYIGLIDQTMDSSLHFTNESRGFDLPAIFQPSVLDDYSDALKCKKPFLS